MFEPEMINAATRRQQPQETENSQAPSIPTHIGGVPIEFVTVCVYSRSTGLFLPNEGAPVSDPSQAMRKPISPDAVRAMAIMVLLINKARPDMPSDLMVCPFDERTKTVID